MTDISSMI